MRFEFKPSFERSIKSLKPTDKQEIKDVAVYLIDILSQDRPRHYPRRQGGAGLG